MFAHIAHPMSHPISPIYPRFFFSISQPPPKAHYLMPTMPSTHEGKGMPKPTAKSVNPEEEEQRKIFHENR